MNKKEFDMFDEDNIRNCAECPLNTGCDSWPGTTLPCGQQNCWCEIYIARANEYEDEDE